MDSLLDIPSDPSLFFEDGPVLCGTGNYHCCWKKLDALEINSRLGYSLKRNEKSPFAG